MEKHLKLVTIGTIVTGIVGLVLLLISLFSAVWISGDLPDTYTVNRTSTGYTKTNTSGSCSEGVFTECCNTRSHTVVVIPGGFSSNNNTDDSCYVRGKSDFHGEKHGGFVATQFFSALSLILTGCGFLVAILFYCVSKFQNGIVVTLFMMALFYGAGWSLYLAVVTDVVILAAALLSTAALVILKRNADPQYGNF